MANEGLGTDADRGRRVSSCCNSLIALKSCRWVCLSCGEPATLPRYETVYCWGCDAFNDSVATADEVRAHMTDTGHTITGYDRQENQNVVFT